MPVIPVFFRLRQEDHKFDVSLDYIIRSYFKTQQKKRLGFYPQIIFVCVCVWCVRRYLCAYKYTYTCVHMCVRPADILGVIPQKSSTLPLLRQGLSLAWTLPIRAGWLASGSQGSVCLCLFIAGITSVCGVPIFLKTWVLGVGKASPIRISSLPNDFCRQSYLQEPSTKEGAET